MKVRLIYVFIIFNIFISKNILANSDDPEIVFLEFLGSFETKDEEWFDPTLLSDNEVFDEKLDKGQNDE